MVTKCFVARSFLIDAAVTVARCVLRKNGATGRPYTRRFFKPCTANRAVTTDDGRFRYPSLLSPAHGRRRDVWAIAMQRDSLSRRNGTHTTRYTRVPRIRSAHGALCLTMVDPTRTDDGFHSVAHGARRFGVTVILSAPFGASSFANDPSAGSPTETLLRLLLPLDEQVWSSSQNTYPGVAPRVGSDPRTSLIHPIGSSDGRCVQRAGT